MATVETRFSSVGEGFLSAYLAIASDVPASGATLQDYAGLMAQAFTDTADLIEYELANAFVGSYVDARGHLVYETNALVVRAIPLSPGAISPAGSALAAVEITYRVDDTVARAQGPLYYAGMPFASALLPGSTLSQIGFAATDALTPGAPFTLSDVLYVQATWDGASWAGRMTGFGESDVDHATGESLGLFMNADAAITGFSGDTNGIVLHAGTTAGGYFTGTATDGVSIDSVAFAGAPLPMSGVYLSNPLAAYLAGDDTVTMLGAGDGFIATYGGNDTIAGGPGDDTVDTGLGSDLVGGGPGDDAVVFRGNRQDYTVEKTGIDFIVRSLAGDDADYVYDVEWLGFANQAVDLLKPAYGVAPGKGRDPDFLLDPVYYLLSNPDLVGYDAVTVAQHYAQVGSALGLAPNAWFDPAYYEARWPDLAPLNLSDGVLFAHFNLYGVWEGRAPGPLFHTFDGQRYLAENPDIAAYVDAHVVDFMGSRSNGAIAHFILYGADEQRVAYDGSGQAIDMGYLL